MSSLLLCSLLIAAPCVRSLNQHQRPHKIQSPDFSVLHQHFCRNPRPGRVLILQPSRKEVGAALSGRQANGHCPTSAKANTTSQQVIGEIGLAVIDSVLMSSVSCPHSFLLPAYHTTPKSEFKASGPRTAMPRELR